MTSLPNDTGARERMLGRLRAAAPRRTEPTGAPAAPDALSALDARIDAHFDARRGAPAAMAATTAAGSDPRTRATRVAAMRDALVALHAEVWCTDEATWPTLLAARLADELQAAGRPTARLLLDRASGEGRALEAALAGLAAKAPPSPIIETTGFERPIEAWKPELFHTIDAGFTVVRSGIAATGTLIVAPDVAAPRTVSLVPPLHIALVYADTLHPDLHAAARRERWRDGMPSNLVMISGPSKTSDIQQTLAYGAHGPKRLWVWIVERDAPQTSDGEPA